jgi:hypothetical protein
MTVEQARSIALEQPGASEGAHHGHPDFRVGKTLFATLWPDERRSVLKLPLAFAESLEALDPERFKVVSRPKEWGWVSVQLDRIEVSEFSPLMEMARSLVKK